jgi:hypothetical protein
MSTKWTVDLDVPAATSSVARISFSRTTEGGFSDPNPHSPDDARI